MPITSKTFAKSTVAFLLVGLVSLLAIAVVSLWEARRVDVYANDLVKLQTIRRTVFRVVDLAQDAETGQRGFLLTGKENYLAPFVDAPAILEREFSAVSASVDPGSPYGAETLKLEGLIRDKISELSRTVELARSGHRDDALAFVDGDAGKNLMEQIRSLSDDVVATIDAQLGTRATEMRSSAGTLVGVLGAGCVLILCMVGASTWMAWRYTRDLDAARREVLVLNATLEERVQERTAELERANEEIQRFAYIVSHDLRAPLVNIMGFTSELEAGIAAVRAFMGEQATEMEADPAAQTARLAIDAEMPEAIGFIRSSTTKMDGLINAILKLSREGVRVLNPTRIDMLKLLEAASDSVRHQLAERGGEIEVITPMPSLVSDRLALEQVFGNLLDNAVKYLDPRRPGRIVVRGRETRAGVEYEIADNGRGIAPADHARVFELFRRSGAQDRPGEGIGLSHVRALVRRLGGEITLESELGQGATFRVRLPRNLPQRGEAR
jgi:signal transduction histidine kinase